MTRVKGRQIASGGANVGDVLSWNGTAWVPAPGGPLTDTRYVDAAGGSDVNGTGSSTAPFATITAAIADLIAGSTGAGTVILALGDYTAETLTLNLDTMALTIQTLSIGFGGENSDEVSGGLLGPITAVSSGGNSGLTISGCTTVGDITLTGTAMLTAKRAVIGGDTTIQSDDPIIKLYECEFETDPIAFIFTGAAGQLWMDSFTNYWWQADNLTSHALTNGTIRVIDLPTTVLQIPDRTTSLGATNIFASNPPAGLYRVVMSLEVDTLAAAGTLTGTVVSTGLAGTKTRSTSGLSVTSQGYVDAIFICPTDGASNITYAATLAGLTGTPHFSGTVTVERLA